MLTAVGENVKETGYAHQGGKQTSADDYIPKPVENADLIARVKAPLK
jgi:DNA-binding response OmpR family regulator